MLEPNSERSTSRSRTQHRTLRLAGIAVALILVTVLVVTIVSATSMAATSNVTNTPLGVSNFTETPLAPGSSDSTHAVMPPTPSVEVSTTNMEKSPLEGRIKTVFVIAMENHNWADIKDRASAPYINGVLLPQASRAEQYYNPPGKHPSEPNYLWLEAGTNFGIYNDDAPSSNHQGTTAHLVTLLDNKGISWKAYSEGISGKTCPLTGKGLYAPKHNPMVFFDDVTAGNDPSSTYCIAHERPYSELTADLEQNRTARYNFIVPDLCDDMHNVIGCASHDSVKNGDEWLKNEVPKITGSQGYKDGGALFITWDEAENGSDGPIGMILMSPYAKGGGYSNSLHYTHSSTLRTMQEIFGVTPLLGDAANATDLSDLFQAIP